MEDNGLFLNMFIQIFKFHKVNVIKVRWKSLSYTYRVNLEPVS